MYSEKKECQLGAHLSLIVSTMIAISKDDCVSLIEKIFLKNARIITGLKVLVQDVDLFLYYNGPNVIYLLQSA